MTWLLLIFSSLISCLGQLCQKQAAAPINGASNPGHLIRWLGLAVFCLGIAMLLWLQVLRSLPVGIAYPMLSMNFIWVTLAARWLWGEPVSLRHWCGTGLIILGIVLISGAV
ncbi:4-amino-4-deoxy-L-arabinose-phosphoundecaprenol flippase subunit ArnE [Tatumella citrea]|uniref:Probable 4-amino-4-deoxy-L-arabinose-phosphoundecaprenol flippase subunit ArnE n=1 Tax=Tatumella citrea TaxID=53336 RepID=A0A1Y0LB40_TATCI|nr:4-amino-4-deoxy-L-arabinose-phosphoundecaprenol flippase subunit ArnE [Tatumella citrea]ARU94838.1 4-amino-4-deoxy-L-arabinose-phospho-UDP flippase [Tatumella citrea]ARU98876.1 4-amino-4-deoxy-L-arabinose-phospho-UDP flippase [Tatumella citrea]